MKKNRKEQTIHKMEEMNHRIAIIKDFANKMGYKTYEEDYTHGFNGRPCHCISLEGTSDSEGNEYAWAWYRDTYEEF